MEKAIMPIVLKELKQYKEKQVNAVLAMLDEGNTVPFISRYRKERTESLDEVQIREIESTYKHVESLEKRKAEVIHTIDEQGNLTDTLKNKINAAQKLQQVEDYYLPFKQKRRTKATIAKEAGLEPFAKWLLTFPQVLTEIEQKAVTFVNVDETIMNEEDVFAGAHEILAEAFGESAEYREWIRKATQKDGLFEAKVKSEEKDEKEIYRDYYEFSESLKSVVPHRVLAINRGEKEGILKASVVVPEATIMTFMHFRIIGKNTGDAVSFIEDAYRDSYKRFIKPAIEREIRKGMTEVAEEQAINVFGDNLYHLLMQAPLKGKIVLGFDPAYRTGCKLAIVDGTGKFLDKLVIYPHKPASGEKRAAAAGQFKKFLDQYQVEMIAIGNGTASRESEQFVSDILKEIERPIFYVIVNEAGASVYSASQAARDEFPELHVEERSAISIGRRLQDPLAELIKIDPKSVGVGQYQHDVAEKKLDAQLDVVIENAVNNVGVNLNTASSELLTKISGLNLTIAKNVVTYRDENGKFTKRQQLKKVPRLGPKAYEQAIGFLRIVSGDNILDNTDIHPESYPLTKLLLKELGIKVTELGQAETNDQLAHANADSLAQVVDSGVETISDILTSLQKPGRDLRDDMPAPLLRHDVLTIEDLKPGMSLQGTVRNVIDFGAFVDIGVKQDGLVHISQLTDKFVKKPSEVVAVGDIVTVWVMEVDLNRHRVQLTMKRPADK
ncbi:Tex family protein [Dellaglioa algida]|uniref:Tex family protein n=1 Tax=Dellaglioa algida TaxID=105612 RepID=UPI000BC537C0|nr:Tex family protein [Dellaglioa algida]MDK1718651.1 RNA-binding transcriptional accessory protein [Dellaglioa algida]MDK1730270.1 RNA-binding transcriptional accessory protein [Dellaglioa algida]MDK1742704.1 RNA-binding transcriptional accessory protein [Dellaglioa algida]SOB51391.1 RNA helicase transcriptional accessory protein [Dellaglioa algida]